MICVTLYVIKKTIVATMQLLQILFFLRLLDYCFPEKEKPLLRGDDKNVLIFNLSIVL